MVVIKDHNVLSIDSFRYMLADVGIALSRSGSHTDLIYLDPLFDFNAHEFSGTMEGML